MARDVIYGETEGDVDVERKRWRERERERDGGLRRDGGQS